MVLCLVVCCLTLNADEPHDQKPLVEQALELKSALEHELTPTAVRQYTVLLIENYVKQALWRSFFLRDLKPGETVLELRAHKEGSPHDILIEDNLEELLIAAGKKFPDDPEVTYAQAYYHYLGSCCEAKPLITFTKEAQVLAIEKARTAGFANGRAVFSLVEEEASHGKALKQEDLDLLIEAYSLDQLDPEISGALLEQLLMHEKPQSALRVAEAMYKAHDFLQQRLMALHGTARAYLQLNQYQNAMKAIKTGLKLAPDHYVLLTIGLVAAREQNDNESYKQLIADYLNHHHFMVPAFETYFAFLVKHGTHPLDEEVASALETMSFDSVPTSLDRYVGVATLWLRLKKPAQARTQFVHAREILQSDKQSPEALLQVVEQGIQACDEQLNHRN